MRQAMSHGADREVFRQTAQKTKVLNVTTTIPRGGIRL